jgi:hypothetical protein
METLIFVSLLVLIVWEALNRRANKVLLGPPSSVRSCAYTGRLDARRPSSPGRARKSYGGGRVMRGVVRLPIQKQARPYG